MPKKPPEELVLQCDQSRKRVEVLLAASDRVQARLAAVDAARLGERVLGESSDLASHLSILGSILLSSNDWEAAEPFIDRSLKLKKKLGATDESLALGIHNLATVYSLAKRYSAAVQLYTEELELTEGDIRVETLLARFATISSLREVLRATGRDRDADSVLQREIHRLHAIFNGADGGLVLAQFARYLRERGLLDVAEELFVQAVRRLDAAGAQAKLAAAEVRNGLGVLLLKKGDYKQAEAVVVQALHIARTIGADSSVAILNLAQIRRAAGDLSGACRFYEQCLNDLKPDTQGHDQVLIEALRGWSKTLAEQRKFSDAAALTKKILTIYENGAFGIDARREAELNLGLALRALGQFGEARKHLERALELSRDNTAPSDVAGPLDALGLLEVRVGNFTRALDLLEQAYRIRLARDNQVDVAISINNLGTLYEALNDLPKAIQHYEASLATLIDIDRDNRNLDATLNNLALALQKNGDVGRASKMFEVVIQSRRRRGEGGLWSALRNMAGLLEQEGTFGAATGRPAEPYYARAEALLREALEALRESGDTANQEEVNIWRGLGWLAYCGGKLDHAEQCYERAEALQGNFPIVSEFAGRERANRAAVLAAMHRGAEALDVMLQHAALEDGWIDSVFGITSESQRLEYMRYWRGSLYTLLSLLLEQSGQDPTHYAKAMNVVLRRKGIVADSIAAHQPTETDDDQRAATIRAELVGVREILARAALGDPSSNLQSGEDLSELQQRREWLEAELSRHSSLRSSSLPYAAVSCASVAKALHGAVLVEYLRIGIFDFLAVPARGERRWKKPRYVAFVLRESNADEPRLIDLGDAEEIDRAVTRWRMTPGVTSQAGDAIGSPRTMAEWEPAGKQLRRLIFDPLLAALGDTTRLVLAPDGLLNLVPFEGLSTENGSFLIDEYQISYLSTGRDLLRVAPTGQNGSAPVVAADPDFDYGIGASPEYQADQFLRSPDLVEMVFPRLPSTRSEGECVAKLLGVAPVLGSEVAERKLLSVRSPEILHIATHGFFLGDEKEVNASISGMSISNPMLRSGLALAGANWRAKGFRPPIEAGDGLLVAEEVASMSLGGTDLAVLSACDTGLGAMQVGEGVFGLRRAFVLAGVDTLVMSLWKVPDDETSELMTNYYAELLRGTGRADALRTAQLRVREHNPQPFFWAAFICQGDPGPLSRFRSTMNGGSHVSARQRRNRKLLQI